MELCSARYDLVFHEPAITSRARMLTKETYFMKVSDADIPGGEVITEVPLFRGLSEEDTPEFESRLKDYCAQFTGTEQPWCSSLAFATDAAHMEIERRNNSGLEQVRIPINGLVWMGDKRTMYHRICQKLNSGFRCVKLKIGGIDFADELDLLKFIRRQFSASDLELRADANGAFSASDALEKLKRLSDYELHSIEQPVKAGQRALMRSLTETSPIPIALDEELIGNWSNRSDAEMQQLLDDIRPAYIILKPSLCGGFRAADRWIASAEQRGIGWWATSALESNIGLSSIALWLSKYDIKMPQGLGTGALYSNNFCAPLRMEGDELLYDPTVTYPYNELDIFNS